MSRFNLKDKIPSSQGLEGIFQSSAEERPVAKERKEKVVKEKIPKKTETKKVTFDLPNEVIELIDNYMLKRIVEKGDPKFMKEFTKNEAVIEIIKKGSK